MKVHTSDWHLGELPAAHTHTFLRPQGFNDNLIENLIWPCPLDKIAEFNFGGDMAIDLINLEYGCKWVADNIKGKKVFILGDKETNNKNFTLEQALEIINKYFDVVVEHTTTTIKIDNVEVEFNMVHKPVDVNKLGFGHSIVGHVHGTVRVFKTKDGHALINTGIDAWCFQVVPEYWIAHQFNAVKEYYDDNIFINF